MWTFASESTKPFPGIGPGPLSDAEFEARVARYLAQFGVDPDAPDTVADPADPDAPSPTSPRQRVLARYRHEPDPPAEQEQPETAERPRRSARRRAAAESEE